MTDKEIIIDGEREKVNILFECNHIEDIEAFDMIKQGIEITPQNAPIGDFKIKIISNIHSPYGFSSICSKSKKSEDWEYMGLGHSGACSIVTALLKELSIKTAECEELKRKLSNQEQLYQNEIEIYNQSCLQLRQENDDLYLERLALNTANSGINALLEVKEQESNRYRKALEEIENFRKKHCDFLCEGNRILDIINKAKGEGDE